MLEYLFLIKFASSRTATLLKKIHWRRCFPVAFVKFLRTPFYRILTPNHFWNLHIYLKRVIRERLTKTVLIQRQSPKVFHKISVHKILANFKGNYLYRSFSFITVAYCASVIQVSPSEICQIFLSAFFIELLFLN